MEIEVSNHACERGKTRLGLNKKAMKRQGELAWNRGIRHGETKGRLRKYIDKEALRFTHKANCYIVFNSHLFFFRKIDDDKMIVLSMIKIPQNLANNLNNYIK